MDFPSVQPFNKLILGLPFLLSPPPPPPLESPIYLPYSATLLDTIFRSVCVVYKIKFAQDEYILLQDMPPHSFLQGCKTAIPMSSIFLNKPLRLLLAGDKSLSCRVFGFAFIVLVCQTSTSVQLSARGSKSSIEMSRL